MDMNQENLNNPNEDLNAEEVKVNNEEVIEQPNVSDESIQNEVDSPEISEDTETTEEYKEENLPIIDFNSLNCEDILDNAIRIVKTFHVKDIKGLMEDLPFIFEKKFKKERLEYIKEFNRNQTEDEEIETPEYKPEIKKSFEEMYKDYKNNKYKYAKEIEAEREENLKAKLDVIEELKGLVQREETLQKTFQDFREIQDKWKSIGQVPQAKFSDLQETYLLHLENFYSYIKINKELRDLDLKRNMDDKVALCEEAERLVEENNIGEAFKQLQLLHNRWKEIGPVHKDQKEEMWERFKLATSKINENHHSFIESIRREQEDNLKVKEDIYNKALAVSEKEYKTVSEWNSATKKILDLQDEWKHAGTIPQKERSKLYKKFRGVCDNIFDRKRLFYSSLHDQHDKNLELKIKLCEKVEAVKDSTDWKKTTSQIITFQKEWKKIGPAPKRHSNKVWNRFRTACDEFFNNKKEFFKDIDAEQDDNLKKKQDIIAEVKNLELSDNHEENMNLVKSIHTRWNEVGFVPIKQKNSIQDEFKAAMDGLFDKLNMNEFDKNVARFKAKMEGGNNSGDKKDYRMLGERDKLAGKIKQLESDIQTWENNMGFISDSSKSQSLLHSLEKKIETSRERLASMVEKLKAIDSLL